MAIKVIAIQRAFFNGEIIKPGRILNIKGDQIPSWAKKVTQGKGEETKTPQAPPAKKDAEQQTLIPPGQNETPANPDEGKNENENIPAGLENNLDLSGKTDEELNVILDELITKGLEANVYLENTEGKSVIEQIQELTAAIKKAETKGE